MKTTHLAPFVLVIATGCGGKGDVSGNAGWYDGSSYTTTTGDTGGTTSGAASSASEGLDWSGLEWATPEDPPATRALRRQGQWIATD